MDGINPGRDQVVRVTVACGVLATVAVLLRFAARWRSKASFAADDWWMVASLIPSYGMLVVGSISLFLESAFPTHVNTCSGHKRWRWPALKHVDRKADGNILEGQTMNLDTLSETFY